MYNQTEVILSQYEIEISNVTKGRGNYICETNKGKMVLAPFFASQEKGMLICRFLSKLKENFPAEQNSVKFLPSNAYITCSWFSGGEEMQVYADIDDLIFAEEVSLPSDR